MKKTVAPLALIARLAVASPALAAGGVKYKGKTSSGNPITFKLKKGRIHDLTAGVRMACIPIQGGGRPLGGSDVFGFSGSRPIRRHDKWTFMAKPAFHWREVTTNYEFWLKKRGKGRYSGRMRLQYSFLISKYPIGTFVVYSCLGGGTFKAKARS
jgi:hypothetical protein